MERHSYDKARESAGVLWRRRLKRAYSVGRERGLWALIRAVVRTYVVGRRAYYLYLHHHRVWPEGMFQPRLSGWEEHFIRTNDEADLLARTHQDIRDVVPSAGRALDAGAVAFCIYVAEEVAHIGWLATAARGRRALDLLGYQVHFDEGEAWTGAAWTVPSFRGKGLLTYSCHRRFEYLLGLGCEWSRGAVETDNRVSHRATMRFKPHVYAVGRQWRVFGKRWWSERELREPLV